MTETTGPANVLAQHPPAMKVGGRRLSVSSKPKPHTSADSPPDDSSENQEPADYPRPAAPGEEHAPPPPHHEEEIPKKEKKHHHGNYEKLKESAYGKTQGTHPALDEKRGWKKDLGRGGRITQPAERGLA